MNEKFSHAEVAYEHPAKGEHHCAECKHYLGNACEIVVSPIQAVDWCDRFKMAEEKKHNASLYRAIHHMNRGGLHRALNVPEGEKIPAEKMERAKNSGNEHVRHMAAFAHTLEGFHHG